MRSATQILVLASLASLVAAADHQVMVGQGGLVFVPNSVTAATGDTVTFIWENAIPHTVTQTSFAAPCAPLSGGFSSGSVTASTSSPVSMVVTVSSTDPIWVSCQTVGHCSSGMVMAINPSASDTIAAFQAAAATANDPGSAAAFSGTGVGASAAALVTGAISSAAAASSSAPASSAAASSAPPTTSAAASSAAGATSTAAAAGGPYGNGGGSSASSSAPAAATTSAKSGSEKVAVVGTSLVAAFLFALMM